MLNEYNGVYRQVFTDGRPLPDDPNPSWQGYSSATWSGDTLVIDTIGFRDDVWLDWAGSMITERRQAARANPAARLRPPRDRGDGRRSQGLHAAVVGDLAAAVRGGYGADRRNLRRRREVREATQVTGDADRPISRETACAAATTVRPGRVRSPRRRTASRSAHRRATASSSQLTATEAAAPPLGSLNVPPWPTGRLAIAAGTCEMRLKSSIPFSYAMSVGPPSM